MTRLQSISVSAQVGAKLSAIFSDNWDVAKVKASILDDVIKDIDATADWSGLDVDEVVTDDINIAIARVLKKRILG